MEQPRRQQLAFEEASLRVPEYGTHLKNPAMVNTGISVVRALGADHRAQELAYAARHMIPI